MFVGHFIKASVYPQRVKLVSYIMCKEVQQVFQEESGIVLGKYLHTSDLRLTFASAASQTLHCCLCESCWSAKKDGRRRRLRLSLLSLKKRKTEQ